MIIAIDGPSAAGKGTLARRLAAHFGYAYLDTGLLYRATALKLLRAEAALDDGELAAAAAADLSPAELDDPELRTDPVAKAASRVATQPAVRAALVVLQRRFAAAPPTGTGAVLDGRDIGTVICPDAEIKLFVTASDEERARRRHKELRDRGVESIQSRVLEDMRERDARDRGRDIAPLRPAGDAFVLDTTDLDEDAAFDAALHFITSQRPGGRD